MFAPCYLGTRSLELLAPSDRQRRGVTEREDTEGDRARDPTPTFDPTTLAMIPSFAEPRLSHAVYHIETTVEPEANQSNHHHL